MKKIRCKLNKKANKKGFTLVELLVCVAILAVIAMICAQFVSHSTSAYRRVASTTKIQETCQDALNQVANIIRNSKSLEITVNSDNGITMKSKNYENKNIRLVYVPNDNELEDFGKIYVCYDYDETIDITSKSESEEYNDYLLTDMVTDFTISRSTYNKYLYDEKGNHKLNPEGEFDYEPVVQERVVDLSLTLERNDREYTHNFKASLRNSSPEGEVTDLVISFPGEVTSSEEPTD